MKNDCDTPKMSVLEPQVGCEAKVNPAWCRPPCPPETAEQTVSVGEECLPCETEPLEVCPECPKEPAKQILVPSLKVEIEGCSWDAECMPSIPPAIGCAPVHVGFGQYDGGIPRWTGMCLEGCDKALAIAKNPYNMAYLQDDWEHVKNLATHPEHFSHLMVDRDGGPNAINEQELVALAVKLARLSYMAVANPEVVSENNLGIAYVKDETTGAYGLSATHNGLAVGVPLPLVAEVDESGKVISISLPLPA